MHLKRLLLFLLCLLLLSACSVPQKKVADNCICVRFLDVGHGSAILISSKDGHILIDTGGEETQHTLRLRLEQLGVKQLELLVLTHPDEDHIGGADAILSGFSPKTVWLNGAREESDSFRRLNESLARGNFNTVVARVGSAQLLGGAALSVLFPSADVESAEPGNSNCLCLKLVYGNIGFLLMADAEEDTEKELLMTFSKQQLEANVLSVGHHGSDSSSKSDFLDAVSPKYAVISCGAGNPNGHPDGRALTRLENVNAEILRTDLMGEIVFSTDGIQLFVESK